MFLVIWFSCDPFNSESKSTKLSDYNVLNGTDTVRASEALLYVGPNGVAGAAGTQAAPTTLQDAINRLAQGGQIWVLDGTYTVSSPIKTGRTNSGTSSSKNKIFANSGTPVFDGAGMALDGANRVLSIEGNYWHVKGIKFQNAATTE
jgi:hypothetical protein